ncbi:hypothetical protein [Thermococcus sp. 21S7]|uniref:hypothetical protein n=1 Tax=Thermococcus sp. 21S7 TaxID=1638221 RepID=UPI00143C09E2|nr:hypothetical protein [Thermococcus sp. 21S7]NJE61823.1 hypothetical protein [Thermococcus sp. 21S7]
MGRIYPIILIVVVLACSLFSVPSVSPASGGSLNGIVMIDVNVTVVNTAPFPKFLVLNPNYDFRVYRLGGNETSTGFVAGSKTQLNYNPGIWLMPYETVVINFNITKTESYGLPQVSCTGGDGTHLACGVVVPQLINSPSQLSAKSMFPIMDDHIKVLSYEGAVRFVVSSPPDNSIKYFALTVPVVFVDGKMYNIRPNYTMTYEEYKRSLHEYVGSSSSLRAGNRGQVTPAENNMFQLSDTLLTGVKTSQPQVHVPKVEGYEDLPVWFVMTSSGVEIEYRVEWRGGR